jgi:hypothetical protein
MAVWQFVINLIPASAARIAGVNAARMSRAQLDQVVLALPIAEADVLFAKLDMLLPEKPRSYTGLRVWGDEPADDIQVRFDVADLSLPLIGGVCDLARHFDCVFATPEGAIIQPSREAVIRTVLQSDAAHFVQDPQGLIEKAARLDREDR